MLFLVMEVNHMLVTARNFLWNSARGVSTNTKLAGIRHATSASVVNPLRVSKLTPSIALERFEAHQLHLFGYPQKGSTHGYMPEFVLARALQRHPNLRVRKNLNLIHFKLAEKLNGMSDESLEWLLGGSGKTSRGKFNSPSELRAFLNTNVNDILSSQLISRLELLTTAIGYRAIQAKWGQEPIVPKTPDQKKMYDVLREITNGQIVCPINSVYTQRATDSTSNGADVIVCEQDDELSDDEDDAYRGQPNERIPSAYFKAISDNGQPSWVSEARENGVYVRHHVSGTSPLNLSAVLGLLREPGESYAAILENEDEVRELFTALIMPKFLRSDYHSLAETQAGIDHVFAEITHSKDNTLPRSQVIDPITAEQRAYTAMCNAACDEVGDQRISLKQLMENYCLLFDEEKQKQRNSF